MRREDYYTEKLSAERLARCYEIAPPRVRQYFCAEIRHVLTRVRPTDCVLELGCGYGRVLGELAARSRLVVGVDTSCASLRLAQERLRGLPNCRLVQTNAVALGLRDAFFDVVLCIQNGISAFHEDQPSLMREALRVARPGGRILFSTYSERFWDARLEWFRLQSAEGLVGEIDEGATGNGVIVCKDGFRATTLDPDAFLSLAAPFDVQTKIEEVDASSLFCEMIARR